MSSEKIPQQLQLLLLSWNMGNAKARGLEAAIQAGGSGCDIIVFGLQESTYKIKSSSTLHASDESAVASMEPDLSSTYEDAYSHSIDAREARLPVGRGNFRVIGAGPAIGFYVNEKTGRMTAD